MASKSQKKGKTKPNKNKESSQINKHPCFCNCSIVNWQYIPLIYHIYIYTLPIGWVVWHRSPTTTYETGPAILKESSPRFVSMAATWGHGSADVALRRAALELRHKETFQPDRDGTKETWNHRVALEGFLSPHSNWDIIMYWQQPALFALLRVPKSSSCGWKREFRGKKQWGGSRFIPVSSSHLQWKTGKWMKVGRISKSRAFFPTSWFWEAGCMNVVHRNRVVWNLAIYITRQAW